MMAVVVVPDEFAVLEECVVVVVAVLVALVPLAALVPELPCDSIRSSFMARLASSVSTVVAAVVVAAVAVAVVWGDNEPDAAPDPGGGEVGEVVDVGDLSGIGISRSIDF